MRARFISPVSQTASLAFVWLTHYAFAGLCLQLDFSNFFYGYQPGFHLEAVNT